MIDYSGLPDADLVGVITAREASMAVAAAEQLAAIAELHTRAPAWITDPDRHCPRVHPVEVTAAEIGPALAISRVAATNLVHLAETVASRLPRAWGALRAGELSLTKLRILAEHTAVLDDAACARVEARVLPRASGQTPPGFGACVRRAVIAADPAAAENRRQAAIAERRVELYPAEDGMAVLRAVLSAPDALAAYRGLTAAAHAAKTDEDDRGIDALRADTLLDLLTAAGLDPATDLHAAAQADTSSNTGGYTSGAAPAAASAARSARPRWGSAPTTVHVTIPFTVLAGLRRDPAYLHGYGPITAEAARELAGDATWRRIITDPESGTVLDVGRTTYTPPAALADHVRTRDKTCRFPGCRQPAAHADLDHTIAHPNGPTADRNLAAGCRGHHRIKTLTTWTVTQDDQARLTWTSPTGQRYTTHPGDDPEPERTDPP